MTSWVAGAADSGYDVDHLPFGAFTPEGGSPRIGVRIGDRVLDVAAVAGAARAPMAAATLADPSLDRFLGLGRPHWEAVRRWLTELLTDAAYRHPVEPALRPLAEVSLGLAFRVGDFVDFYCSLDHATNLGRIFRPDAEPLLPNWRHLPVGYHGRAGTVVPSGTDIVRPRGQRRKGPTAAVPDFGPSRRLDVEAEVGFVVGTGSRLGSRVGTDAFADHVFGVVGVDDWSARDIQAWEYAPLGPFLGKSFATSISQWVTPLAALDAAWVDLPAQHPEPLPYLRVDQPAGLDIDIEVELNGVVVSRPPYASTYWSPAQMLAHLTVNGASVRPGDLFASGTVSGPRRDQRGSLIELSWAGTEPFPVGDGSRTFLEDGDEVTLRYSAPGAGGGRIQLGPVTGRILPAH